MPRLSISLFGATLCLLLAAMFASAQPAPKAKPTASPPAAPPDAKAASAPMSPAPTACPCKGADAQRPAVHDTHQGGTMQGGMMHGGRMDGGMMHGGMMHGGMMHGGAAKPPADRSDRHARLHEAAKLADLKVQTTKNGASIQLIAKKPADTAKVQELAKDIAAYLSEATPHPHAMQRAAAAAQPEAR